MTRKLIFALLFLAAPALFAASDVLTVGTNLGKRGDTVSVPVFVRDVSGSPLGKDQPAANNIQGIGFKVAYAPASAVSSVTFSRAGVMQGLAPLFETTLPSAGAIGYVGSFVQASNPIPFTLDAAAPGNLIGYLNVTISQSATLGASITLTVDATNAALSNQAGTVTETGANGKLTVVNGSLLVTGSARSDFNSDGKSDIIWRNPSTGDTWLWLMSGNAPTAALPLGTVASPWTIAAVADFDGDGKADLVWRNTSTGDTWLWTMDGGTATGHAPIGNVGTAWSIAAAADFDRDGKADLVWRNNTTGDTWVWLMNGAAATAHQPLGTVAPPWIVAGSGDFDGDGKADLIWRNPSTGDTWIWFMNGTAVNGFQPLGTIASPWTVAAVADFDNNGKADIVWRNTSTGDTWVWPAAAVAAAAPLGTIAPPWTIAAAADFDGDGKADLIWRNPNNGDAWMWRMNGTSVISFTPMQNPGAAWTLVATP
jgi:hypothetical protein